MLLLPVSTSRGILSDSIGIIAHSERRMAPHTCARCARRAYRSGTLRALNYMLAILGVLMMSWDFFAYTQWSQEEYHRDWPHAPTDISASQPQRIHPYKPMIKIYRADEHMDSPSISFADESLHSNGVQSETEEYHSNRNSALQYTILAKGRYATSIFSLLRSLLRSSQRTVLRLRDFQLPNIHFKQ